MGNNQSLRSALAMANAEVQALKRDKVALIRHIEHGRIVQALMLRRLGGYAAFHEQAMARATMEYDVEIGNRAGLVVPDAADLQAIPEAEKGPIVFRLIDKASGEQLEAGIGAMPQRVMDLLEAVEALPQGGEPLWLARAVAASKALRSVLVQHDNEAPV